MVIIYFTSIICIALLLTSLSFDSTKSDAKLKEDVMIQIIKHQGIKAAADWSKDWDKK